MVERHARLECVQAIEPLVDATAESLDDPAQPSVGTVIVCDAHAETLQPFGIVVPKIGGVNAERLF